MINITGLNAACPPFEARVIQEDENYTIRMDENGCKVRMFKDHSVPASISWDNYRYFIDALKKSQTIVSS